MDQAALERVCYVDSVRDIRPELSAGMGPIDMMRQIELSFLFPVSIFVICAVGGVDWPFLDALHDFLFANANSEGYLQVLDQAVPVVITPPEVPPIEPPPLG